ncbi:MAG: nucleotide-binding protein [Chloroflexota bacterium]|nr:nucleotide-binding protein [Chloroflexota bacterium]
MDPRKPALFVGSSTEGLRIAQAITFQLQHDAEITIWNENHFGLGSTVVETLVNSLQRFDFAILVLTPDDLIISRHMPGLTPRDNVMFELGLFMGYLGRERTFIVYDKDMKPKIPSDLAGITAATYDGNRSDGNLIAAVSPACTMIRETIKALGVAESKRIRQLERATTDIEDASASVTQLVNILARSRAVELDLISVQFGSLISPAFLKKMQQDLKDLEALTQKGVDDTKSS